MTTFQIPINQYSLIDSWGYTVLLYCANIRAGLQRCAGKSVNFIGKKVF